MKQFLLGLLIGALLVIGVTTVAQTVEYPTMVFTPYSNAVVYASPRVDAVQLRTLTTGVPVTIYTPYVGISRSPEVDTGGDGLLWASLNDTRTEWVAVAVHGYCPRERLGDIARGN